MTPPAVSARASGTVTTIAVAALIGGPALDYLRYHHYPLLAPEVLGALAVALTLSIIIGRALNRATGLTRRVAFALLVLLFTDMQFLNRITLSLAPSLVLLLALAPIAVAVWWLEQHIERIIAVTAAAFFALSLPSGSVIRSSSLKLPDIRPDTSLPPVLYLILDEHIGTEGWPRGLPATEEMRDRTRAFYLDRGFRLYGNAYSPYFWTATAIPGVLNWPLDDPRQSVAELYPWSRYRLKTNNVFGRLGATGYRFRVYQSTYLDFCDYESYAIQSCETRPGNTVRNISWLPLPAWSKMILIGNYFLQSTNTYRAIQDLYGSATYAVPWLSALPPWRWRGDQANFGGAMQLLAQLQHDLRSDQARGTVYFAHLLTPHYPYVVDSECRPYRFPNHRLDRRPPSRAAAGGTRASGSAERAHRYQLYAAQVGCVYRHLESLLRLIDSVPGGDDMVVIMHGDHGSRITIQDPVLGNESRLGPSDVFDSFSTLLALRAATIPPGYDARLITVGAVVGQAVGSRFKEIPDSAADIQGVVFERGFRDPMLRLLLTDTALALREPRVVQEIRPDTSPAERIHGGFSGIGGRASTCPGENRASC